MPDIALRFNKDVLILEGAMGTMLQREGIRFDGSLCAELLNVLEPELISDLHRRYHLAGAQCASTNSFGATRAKLSAYGVGERVEELNRAAVRNARAGGAPHILADVGPCGLVLEPLGTSSFDEVFEQYFEQVSALAAESPDAIFIETMTDIADARCALLAARAACDLPVFVSCTFDENGRMELSGTDARTAVVILEACGAAGVGINCGLGPEELLPILEEMARTTALPLLIQPNAGIPYLNAAGETIFPATAEEFAELSVRFRAAGAQFIGSCCGSTPAFTGAIYAAVGDTPVVRRPRPQTAGQCVLASPRKSLTLGAGSPARIIGERINPTGKPKLTQQLEHGQMSLLREYAETQVVAGADLIDVNVGAAMVDEARVLPQAVLSLVAFTEAPLVLDSTDPVALEAALRVYPGKALINSVNGDPKSLAAVLPLARRYGAALLALALDDSGIPASAEGRMAVIERIRAAATDAGLPAADLVVDMLVLTAATDAEAPAVTLAGVAAATEAGLATVLGVSNVSHGLPQRSALNAAFVRAALSRGLSAAIANPADELLVAAFAEHNGEAAAGDGTGGADAAWQEWQQAYQRAMDEVAAATNGKAGASARATTAPPTATATGAGAGASAGQAGDKPEDGASSSTGLETEATLKRAILRGDSDAVPELIDAVVAAGRAPERIVDALLAPVMSELGEAFARGEAFLPQMIIAANAMKAAVTHIKGLLPAASEGQVRGTVVFCTVQGDVHSIGKDICIALLESQDFRVVDLGVDVEPDAVLQAARREQADAVCLSALMTTTLPMMRQTVELLYAEAPEYHNGKHRAVFVGGAVVSAQWAATVDARYADDAPGCVEAIRQLVVARD
ncbi:MAG: homocysteine S-methyltransferase family protein [Coriobacteriales bacterium]|jgi:5-methyltetrahydrofolate--homocysteine methyltransferase|nr:homocysteine S-methyltransferase family protein [Coriobacteriales bacterium]